VLQKIITRFRTLIKNEPELKMSLDFQEALKPPGEPKLIVIKIQR